MKSSFTAAILAVIIYASFTWLRHWMDDQARELNTPAPLAAVASTAGPQQGQAAPFADYVAFCFFVYAPIFEVGRDHDHAGLFLFAQPRLSWVGGFFEAIKADAAAKGLSEKKLEQYKNNGVSIENKLLKALKTNDPRPFAEAITSAVWCDGKLGLETKWLPTLRRPGIPR